MTRAVTEQDFRLQRYRDAKVEDYEFRGDGALVRKDRWECGIGSIRFLVGINGREYEIDEVTERVRFLAEVAEGVLQLAGDAIWSALRGEGL